MRRISPLARIILLTTAVVGALTYLVVVDLGVNAGVVHRGVKVGHLDLGGLSQAEAAAEIERVGTEMRDTSIRLVIEDVGMMLVYPRDFGWKPRADQMAEAAMAIGREGSLVAVTSDRVSAWFGGRRLQWADPRTKPLRRQIREVIRAARTAGVEVAWNPIRQTLISATFDWPRRDLYRVPPPPAP
jgi:hypothetical protein